MVEAKTRPGKTASGPAERSRPDRRQAVPTPPAAPGTKAPAPEKKPEKKPVKEIGGPKGPEPTRYGDWERKGRCIDF